MLSEPGNFECDIVINLVVCFAMEAVHLSLRLANILMCIESFLYWPAVARWMLVCKGLPQQETFDRLREICYNVALEHESFGWEYEFDSFSRMLARLHDFLLLALRNQQNTRPRLWLWAGRAQPLRTMTVGQSSKPRLPGGYRNTSRTVRLMIQHGFMATEVKKLCALAGYIRTWETISPDGREGHRSHIQVYLEVLNFDVLVVSADYRPKCEVSVVVV